MAHWKTKKSTFTKESELDEFIKEDTNSKIQNRKQSEIEDISEKSEIAEEISELVPVKSVTLQK